MTVPVEPSGTSVHSVLDIEVGCRLLAMPYLASLLRRLCGRYDVAGPEGEEVPNELVSLLERVIVETHRRSADAEIRIELVAAPKPLVRLHLDSPVASELAAEVLTRTRAVSRDAEVQATALGLLVVVPAPAARFATFERMDPLSRTSPVSRSDETPPTDPSS